MLSVISPANTLPAQPAKRAWEGGDAGDSLASTPKKENASGPKPAHAQEPSAQAQDKSTDQDAQLSSVIQQLKQRDQQVRAHEMAHLAAAGAYATSGAQYVYQTGPDGRKYAIGGEVGIDVSPGRDPDETVRKMQIVQQAALAPADPSPQDLRVAAMAAAQMAQAQMALRKSQVEKQAEGKEQADQVPSHKRFVKSLENNKTAYEDNTDFASLLAARQAWEAHNRLLGLATR